jgi:hypothetical protein
MNKVKALPFIILGGLAHLCAVVAVNWPVLECESRTECITPVTRVLQNILGFPLNFISRLFSSAGPVTSLTFIAIILNSFVAMTLVWFVLIRPFVRRSIN